MKYLVFLRKEIKTLLYFRADAVVQILGGLVPLLGILLFVQHGSLAPGGYTPGQLRMYYVLAFALQVLINPEIAFAVAQDVETGSLNRYLIQPLRYPVLRFCSHLKNCLTVVPVLAVVLLFSWLLPGFFLPPASLARGLAFLGMVLLGSVFLFLTGFMVGLLSVWLVKIQGAFYLLTLVLQVLSGGLIPLDLFPGWAARLLQWNPFAFVMYHPIQIYLGEGSFGGAQAGLLLSMLLLLGLLARLLWKKAGWDYQAYGG